MALPNTNYGAAKIADLLKTPKKIFFAGIGGVSMNSLAHISHLRGHTVTGYDRTPSALTAQLEELGIRIWYENDVSHVADIDMLVYTVAIPSTLPEYAEARRRNIPVVSRADYLGYIMTGYSTRLGVCGMHGKSTTTSMLECIFRVAGTDPTVSCGASMKDADGRCDRIGKNRFFIFEACEYMDSFLHFYPTEAIVLNMEMDHLDYFHSMEQIEHSFSAFLAKTGSDGRVYLNADDPHVMRAAAGYPGHIVTFGVKNDTADYKADEITCQHGIPAFTLFQRGVPLCRISLQVPGIHNVCDALAAAAAAVENGIAPETIAQALSTFQGAVRRMDLHGKTEAGAVIYDDYAHHPTELASSIRTAADMDFERIVLVFQPHTYSRTSELFADFASVLSDSALYEVIITDIYSARETDTLGVSGEKLADAIRKNGGNCRHISDFHQISRELQTAYGKHDLILIAGAGDIVSLCGLLTEES